MRCTASPDAVMTGPGDRASVPFLSHVSVVDTELCEHAIKQTDLEERLRSHRGASTSQDADIVNRLQGAGQRSAGRAKGACYTAALLKSTLLLMGCKPRVAHKVVPSPDAS